MTTNDEVRYYLEHEAMPRTLYTAGPQIISALLLKGNKAVAQYYKKAEIFHRGYTCPYTEADFDVMYQLWYTLLEYNRNYQGQIFTVKLLSEV